MPYSFSHLKNEQNTAAGVAETLLFAPVSWFVEGGIKGPGVWLVKGDSVRIKDTHEFLAGKGFISASLAPEKNKLEGKSAGDVLFKQMGIELQVFIPGSYAELHEFIGHILNTPIIALIRDSNCVADLWYQLGDACVYAYTGAEFTTETTKGNVKGYLFTISYSSAAVYLYEGVINRLTDEGGVTVDVALITEDGLNIETEDGQIILIE